MVHDLAEIDGTIIPILCRVDVCKCGLRMPGLPKGLQSYGPDLRHPKRLSPGGAYLRSAKRMPQRG